MYDRISLPDPAIKSRARERKCAVAIGKGIFQGAPEKRRRARVPLALLPTASPGRDVPPYPPPMVAGIVEVQRKGSGASVDIAVLRNKKQG